MQTLSSLFSQFWNQLSSILSELADWVIYVFDPNSGPMPKLIVGGLFFLLVLLVVTRASRAR